MLRDLAQKLVDQIGARKVVDVLNLQDNGFARVLPAKAAPDVVPMVRLHDKDETCAIEVGLGELVTRTPRTGSVHARSGAVARKPRNAREKSGRCRRAVLVRCANEQDSGVPVLMMNRAVHVDLQGPHYRAAQRCLNKFHCRARRAITWFFGYPDFSRADVMTFAADREHA